MLTIYEELKLARQAYDAYYLEETKQHLDKVLALEPDNIEALEIQTWIAFHSDIVNVKQLAQDYLIKKQNLPSNTDLTLSNVKLVAQVNTGVTPQFSLLLSSRRQGNSKNQFKAFLSSLLKHTDDTTSVEIILRIDGDDDIAFFQTQLSRLPKVIQWKLLSGERGKGFLDRTSYIWQAMDYAHPESQYILPLSDNTVFVIGNWDSVLKSLLSATQIKLLNLTESKNYVFNNVNEFVWLLFSSHMQPCYFVVEHSIAREVKKWFTEDSVFRSNGFNLDLIFTTLSANLYPVPNPFFQQFIRSECGTGIESISTRDKQLWCQLDYLDLVEGELFQKCASFAKIQAHPFSFTNTLMSSKKSFLDALRKLKRLVQKTAPAIINLPNTPEEYFSQADISFRKGNLFQAIKQHDTGLQLYLKNKVTVSGDQTVVAKPPTATAGSALISIMLPCRIKGNSNSKLPDYLASIINTAHDLHNIEVMIAFDHDDDHQQIAKILNPISKELRIVPVFMPRGRGYFDLHRKWTELYEYISPTSRALIISSDDSFYSKKDWDQVMVQAMQQYPDDLVFYNLFMPRDELAHMNENTFLWWIFQRGPATLFPAFGRGLVEAMKKAQNNDPNWTCFGPTLMGDSFFEMVRWYFAQASNTNRVVHIPYTIKRVVDSAAYPETAEKLAMRHRDSLLIFASKLSDDTRTQLKVIANEMVKNLISS